MLLRSPASRRTVGAGWLLALGGCDGLVGYSLTRPASPQTHATALLDVAALVAIAVLAAPLLPARLPSRVRDVTAPVLLGLLLVTRPVRDAVLGGQLTPLGIALILYSVPARRRWNTDGIALGLAIAVVPSWALFAVLPWRAGRRAAALIAVGLGGAITALRWGVDGGAWLSRLSGPAPTGADGRLDDASARGILLRLGLHGGTQLAAWLAVVGLVAVIAAARTVHYTRDDQPLLALGVLGTAALVVTPIAWSYDLIWLLAIAVGRLGRRAEDRPAWPILATVPTLISSSLFDPRVEPVTSFALRNAPGLLAVLAAALLPFKMRRDPHWHATRTAVPERHRPFARRWLPLLPSWLLSALRPNLLLELLFIQVGYGLYTAIRNAAPNRVHDAITHGQDVFHAEQLLHLDVEHSLNQALLTSGWLTDWLERYYKTLHFAVPLAILVWLYARRPHQYRPARTILFATTGLALIGFLTYPLAPPRLTPGHGFHDSLHPGGDPDPFGAFTKVTNQFAAMPSLHIGWSTWCALMLVTLSPYLWVRILGALYPVATLLVVLGTANHWLLDAVGALASLTIAYVVQYLLTGQHFTAHRPAPIDQATPSAARWTSRPTSSSASAVTPRLPLRPTHCRRGDST